MKRFVREDAKVVFGLLVGTIGLMSLTGARGATATALIATGLYAVILIGTAKREGWPLVPRRWGWRGRPKARSGGARSTGSR